MHGSTKNTPGPRAPPSLRNTLIELSFYEHESFPLKNIFFIDYLNRPIRKITARSNSDTTLKQKNIEIGIETIISNAEKTMATTSTHADSPVGAKIV